MRKKLCFVCFDLSIFGGAERVTSTLVNRLSSFYSISLISIIQQKEQFAFSINKEVKTYILKPGKHRMRSWLPTAIWKLRKWIKQEKIDVVFCESKGPFYAVWLASRFLKVKTVFCDHEALMNQINDRQATWMRKTAARQFDCVQVLTKQSKNDYIRQFHVFPQKIIQIYNAVDSALFNYPVHYQINSKKIITVSRISKEKGIDMLLDVAEMVYAQTKDWQWDIYGDGNEFELISQEIVKRKLDRFVHLMGADPNVYQRYQDYGLCVLSSYGEGLPLVLLEAKTKKLPIVSFDVVTGPKEIIQNGVDGFLIAMYDKKIMCEKIIELIKNPEMRQNFSDHAYDNIEKFKIDHIVENWINLIEQL